MEAEQKFLTVKDLVELHEHGIAKPNHEYQRGDVWNLDQRMKLIDSILRGYRLPMIYLHYNEKNIGGMKQQSYDIIDGQQRITSLHLFAEGNFPLYEPGDPKAKFPKFIQEQPCDWGGKNIHSLSSELKDQFFEAKIPVATITTDDKNEVRDLFVRLQASADLKPQEKRDAYPGQFTEFILSLGGKPILPRFPGHPFFQRVLHMKPGRDRRSTRQLAAQIAMLYLERRTNGIEYFPDIGGKAIDDYYYANLDFNSESQECKRLRDILEKLDDLLGDGKLPKTGKHEAIHLVLLLDSLWDDYVRSWESHLQEAHGKFSKLLIEANKAKQDHEAWLPYVYRTHASSDKSENIRVRHQYYTSKMMEFLGGLTLKDPKRIFGQTDKEIIYWRDEGKCQICDADVRWKEAEFHHIEEHSKGGRTELDNGALVHKRCHPKGAAQTRAFARKIEERRKAQAAQ